tara:strand:+ start:8848 stop:9948 length:1101 start_codon:yes stop_codon:yes gene_type:complete
MSVFADVFLNPYLVDRIKSFIDYAPLHSYNLPNSFFIPGAAIKELDYDDFFFYCGIKWGYYKEIFDMIDYDDVLKKLRNKKIINTAAEENDFDLIKKITSLYSLTNVYDYNTYSNYCSILSSIKHNNLEMLKYLYCELKTTCGETFNSINNALKLSCVVGNYNITMYILYNMMPRGKRSLFDIYDYYMCINKCIKYNYIDCARALYIYKINIYNDKNELDDIMLSNYIRRRSRYMHNALFKDDNIGVIQINIDWVELEYQANKLGDKLLKSLISTYKDCKTISYRKKTYNLIKYISQLQKIIPLQERIYISWMYNEGGHIVEKHDILKKMIDSLYYQPIKYYIKPSINIYKDLHTLYKIVKHEFTR